MTSSYTPPDVIVRRQYQTASSPPVVPPMPLVVVGLARQIAFRENAGLYAAGDSFQADLSGADVDILAPGAVIDTTTFDVLLDAKDGAGKAVGLFRLAQPTQAQLLADGHTLVVADGMVLEYSLLSSRNNDQSDTLTNDDTTVGTPDGLSLTSDVLDFLARGTSNDGSCYIDIKSPTSMAGRYQVTGLVATGVNVYTVKLEKVTTSHVRELDKTFTLDGVAHALGTNRICYGAPTETIATHDYVHRTVDTAPHNGDVQVNNLTTATVGSGVGVAEIVGTPLTVLTDLFNTHTIDIPGLTNGAPVWFAPPAGVAGKGSDLPAWKALVDACAVGDYLRIHSVFGVVGVYQIRDYKIVGIDNDDYRLQVQDVDRTGSTGVIALALADTVKISVVKVLRGQQRAYQAAGDFVTCVISSAEVEVELLRATPMYVEIKTALPTYTTNIDVRMKRGIPFRGADANFDIIKRTTTDFTGDVLVSFQARRTDLSLNKLMAVATQDDIVLGVGAIHPDNPLALGAEMVRRGGFVDGTRVFYLLAIDDDTVEDWTKALDVLVAAEVYHVIPLTQNRTVQGIYAQHVITQSLPENKHERFLYISPDFRMTEDIYPSTDTDPVLQGTVGADTTKFSTVNGVMDWGIVKPGQVLVLLDTDKVTELASDRIVAVDSANDEVTLLAGFNATYATLTEYFKVRTSERTKGEIAEEWRDYAKSIGSERVMLIAPDEIQLTYADNTTAVPHDVTTRVGGEYACCAWAGAKASMPPQTPMTNRAISGIDQLFHTNEYFNPDQLNTVAEGGVNILIQSAGALPYSRHQLNTCMDSIEKRENSITEAIDYTAIALRTVLRRYIGRHNITREYLTQLRGITETALRDIMEDGVLANAKLVSLDQDKDQPDTVNITVELTVLYPCNRIVITLKI